MYAYVRNIFNEIDDDNNDPLFIKIESVEEMDIYEFFQKLQLLLGENPYDVNSGLSLEAIQNSDLTILNSEIATLINQYSYLGNIDFNITIDNDVIKVTIEMMLNKKISNSPYIIKSFELNKGR